MAAFQPASLRDRTGEFLAIADRLQKRQQGTPSTSSGQEGAAGLGHGTTVGATRGQSEFARRASAIGLGIQKTSAKLQKLANLARRTSMFDDPAQEIAELSGMIKTDIQRLNGEIAELQAASAAQDGGTNKQSARHSNTVVDDLRLQLKDTTKEFQDVLSLRTDNLKGQDSRRELFSRPAGGHENGFLEREPLLGRSAPSGTNKSAHSLFGGQGGSGASSGVGSSGFGAGGLPPGEGSSGATTSYNPHPGLRMRGRGLSPRGGRDSSQQQQQLQMASPQDTYLDSRASALHTAEATIVELGGIFQQLAHMVADHGEMARRIEDDVADTDTNVTMAQAQLLKYLHGISSNRWLIMKIFLVLMVFIVIFVFIL